MDSVAALPPPPRKWAATWQNQQNECAPSENSDQPGYPPSLIRVFAVRMKKAWVRRYPLSAQQRLWSDWADAQADLSLHWAHIHFAGFVMSRLKSTSPIVALVLVIALYWLLKNSSQTFLLMDRIFWFLHFKFTASARRLFFLDTIYYCLPCDAKTISQLGVYFHKTGVLNRLPIWNSQTCSMFPLAFVAGSLQGHWWGFMCRNYVIWPIFFLMNVFIALKGTHFLFLFVSVAIELA